MSGGQKGLNIETSVHLRNGRGGHHSHLFLLVYAAWHQPKQKHLFFICRALSHIFSCCPSFSTPGLISLLWKGVWCVWINACYFWKLRKTVLLLHELGLTWGLGEERRKVCYVKYPKSLMLWLFQGFAAVHIGRDGQQGPLEVCTVSSPLPWIPLGAIWCQVPLSIVYVTLIHGWWAGNDVAGKQGGSSQPLCSWRLWVNQPLAHCFQGQQQPGPAASPLLSARLFLSI